MMEFSITTLQYGSMKDIYIYNGLESLLHDLSNIAELSSVQVLDISKNGKCLSPLQVELLQSLAKQ